MMPNEKLINEMRKWHHIPREAVKKLRRESDLLSAKGYWGKADKLSRLADRIEQAIFVDQGTQ